jgi:TonB family protein
MRQSNENPKESSQVVRREFIPFSAVLILGCTEPGSSTPSIATGDQIRGYIDANVTAPQVTYRPPMIAYPKVARLARIQGDVTVGLTIDEQGKVVEAIALDGPSALREAAVNFAKQWLFVPAASDKIPVRSRFLFRFAFKLE